jgi:hypothetical protein
MAISLQSHCLSDLDFYTATRYFIQFVDGHTELVGCLI